MRQRKRIPKVLLRLGLLAALLLTLVPFEAQTASVTQAAPPSAATTTTLHLRVVSARTEPNAPGGAVTKGQRITSYKYIINEDNVGNPTQARTAGCSPSDPAYPANCTWPSIRSVPAASPIVTQGTNADLDEGATPGVVLPNTPGKYLISVVADGYKIDGAHFSIPLDAPGVVEVGLQPFPLPLGSVKLQVFEDSNVVNGQYDVPGELGLADFEGHIFDVLGEVTTDWYGNPLCTRYDANHDPIPGSGGKCLSDANGVLTFPNIGPNRYTATVVPPNGTNWVQTTTLEGNHDYDVWIQENATGFDTEFTGPNAETVPSTPFGYVKPKALPTITNGATIKGVVDGVKVYIPQQGGLNGPGNVNGAGVKIDKPISRPWIALSDLRQGDTTTYVGQGNADGTFSIPNVPPSDYSMAIWDGPQDFILELRNVTVTSGQIADVGAIFMAGWWTTYEGTIFFDTNGNGKQDPGERGLPGQSVVLKARANNVMERGIASVTTDLNGHYIFREAYPLNSWIVMEVYNDRFQTTGVTFQADNQPTETTVLGAGVDVSVLPVIGLSGRLDWGIKNYAPGTNGGIVGTVSYDTTRNELDPRFAAVEDYQPGIPGLNVKLYNAVKDVNGAPILNPDGSYKKGNLRNVYVTEQWERPQNCVARDVNKQPVVQGVLPLPSSPGDHDCIEAPLMGVQFQAGFSTVDGNYGFGTVWRLDGQGNPIPDPGNPGSYLEDPMPAGDYLVEVEIPNDNYGRPLYQVTKEEDINVFSGDQFVPQIPPPPCAGANHTVHVTNQDFLDAGGSPYEGQQRPLCDVKFITVQNGRSIAPTFNLFTDVPIPGRLYGLIVDDLNVSTNPLDQLYGEKRGLPNSPIGIYDYSDRLITTIQSDPNGYFEVLLPSTSTYNCPLPAGPCLNVYRLLGNDPGVPGKLNPTYDPQYRSISASFENWPGLFMPADLAPIQNATLIEAPGTQVSKAAQCKLDPATPQIFAISRPYIRGTTATIHEFVDGANPGLQFTISGQGFGSRTGSAQLTLTNVSQSDILIDSWTNTTIVFRLRNGGMSGGPHQLAVIVSDGQSTINGLTFHRLGDNGYNPTVLEVGPGKTYATIQAAINFGSTLPNQGNTPGRALVVVYPGTAATYNPLGVYYENLVIRSPMKIQGVGPGGVRADGTSVPGSVVDGLGFDQVNATGWRTLVNGQPWVGNQNLGEGAVFTLLARTQNQFNSTAYTAQIDGLTIQGGDQVGNPNKVNSQPGGVVITQGGGIYANAYVSNLQITNNVIRSNGGTYAGAIRIGNPYSGDNNNDNVHIANNRILANGGTNLAGAIGMFRGSDAYEIDHNDICGNYSAEYGGGISHYGLSGGPLGLRPARIHDNRIYFNSSYDEGAGIFIAGELPTNPNGLSQGSGPVNIENNVIQANLANDDGGGIRFLMAGNFPINVRNNMIVNNISTHEGGGIALDDATNVRIVNNTIMKNITTATASTSNGQPAPAGISSTGNSTQLQATLPGNAPKFSNPLLFNNILWDNRAGRWNGTTVSGIGLTGDATPINYWDMGVADSTTDRLSPTNSILEVTTGTNPSPTNLIGTLGAANYPQVLATYDTSVAILPWRTDPRFVGAAIVAVELPPNLMGNYHLAAGSPAINAGAAAKGNVDAPSFDIDGQTRTGAPDIGADER